MSNCNKYFNCKVTNLINYKINCTKPKDLNLNYIFYLKFVFGVRAWQLFTLTDRFLASIRINQLRTQIIDLLIIMPLDFLKTQRQSGVPPDDIHKIVRLFGDGPVLSDTLTRDLPEPQHFIYYK
jgi:hypothetical protein